jgi:hypothetical protein
MPVSRQDLQNVHDFLAAIQAEHDASWKRAVKAQTLSILAAGAWIGYRHYSAGSNRKK